MAARICRAAFDRWVSPKLPGNAIRTKSGQQPCDRLRITGGEEYGHDARLMDRRKKVLQVEAYHDPAADVRQDVALDRPAAAKAVRRVVRRNLVEQLVQQTPLD